MSCVVQQWGPLTSHEEEQVSNWRKCFYLHDLSPPNIEHSTNYKPLRHKHIFIAAVLSVYAILKDIIMTTNLVLRREPFQELGVIGEESYELVALYVSRLQAGIVETPSGWHNMAVGTWCVKQACHSWIKHGRMPSHEMGRVEKQENMKGRGVKKRKKTQRRQREKEGEEVLLHNN